MTLVRYEETIIPNIPEGQHFADEYVKRLKKISAFESKEYGTQYINIKAKYVFEVRDKE